MTDTPPRRRTPIHDMVLVADSEARRIKTVQTHLVESGRLKSPDPGQTEKMHAFEDIAKLLKMIEPHAKAVAHIVAPSLRSAKTSVQTPDAVDPSDSDAGH